MAGHAAPTGAKIEAKARELYEAARVNVEGRPAWEELNPEDQYDMGMRDLAVFNATVALSRLEAQEGK